MNMPQIAARLFNTPLMVHEGKARTILAAFGPRILGSEVIVEGHRVEPPAGDADSMGKLGNRLGRALERWGEDGLFRYENVGVIAIEGSLVHKGAWIGKSSGQTSYEGIQTQIRAAAEAHRAGDIAGVVFEVDSPGGEVSGAFDTAAMIRDLSARMPTMAILTDSAYSAGLLLASGARQIVMPETGGIGAIGVITLHADYSKALKESGIKVTILTAGDHKADGNPYEPLPADVAASIREELEAKRMAFAQAVADGRGNRFSADDALATEAATYLGREAVDIGMADAVAHPSQAFEAFVSELAASPRSPFTMKGPNMANASTAAAKAATDMIPVAEAQATADAQATAARTEGFEVGKKEGLTEGASAERTRMAAILGSEEAKGRDDLARHFAFNTNLPADDARAAMAAAPAAAAANAAPAPAEDPAQANKPGKSQFEQAMEREAPGDLGDPSASNKPRSEKEQAAAAWASAYGKDLRPN